MKSNEVSEWPVDWMEDVCTCPLCKSVHVSKRENGLVDWLSIPPSGCWQLNICGSCGVGYLSPRPNCESIKHAYSHYHTHTSEKDDLVSNYLRLIKDFFSEK